jgi:hypothetical protein
MDCDTIHNLFMNFENRVNNNVRKRILQSDFFINNVPRKPWPKGQGRQFSYPSYDRAGLAAGFLPFTAIPAYGEGSTCEIPAVEVPNFASSLRNATLHHSSTNTPDFCLMDLEYDWQIAAQLDVTIVNMTDATKFNWGQELMRQYVIQAGNKLIYTPDLPTSSSWLATAPTSGLDWDVLGYVYQEAYSIAMDDDYAGTDEEGKVVLQAVGEFEVFDHLKSLDSNERADINAVIQGGSTTEQRTLIGSRGLPKKTYRGYVFETIKFAPRYDLVAGVWKQRFPWLLEAKTNGYGLEIDPLYKNAGYTDVIIFSKKVFDHLVPAPPQDRSGYNWDGEVDWLGRHKWVKLPVSKDCNPDGSKGFWRSTYGYGPQTQRPDLGWAIRVKRCGRTYGQFSCETIGSL